MLRALTMMQFVAPPVKPQGQIPAALDLASEIMWSGWRVYMGGFDNLNVDSSKMADSGMGSDVTLLFLGGW